MKDDDVIAMLIEKLRWLRLPGMAATLPAILAQAAKDNLTVAEWLARAASGDVFSRFQSHKGTISALIRPHRKLSV